MWNFIYIVSMSNSNFFFQLQYAVAEKIQGRYTDIDFFQVHCDNILSIH